MITTGIISTEIERITPMERHRLESSYAIAEKIDAALKSKGISYREFAKLMHRKESEVRQWVGGFYNFRLSTLSDISYVLGIEL